MFSLVPWNCLNCELNFFFFRLFPSGVATADSPYTSIKYFVSPHSYLLHVLTHHIQIHPLWSSPFYLSLAAASPAPFCAHYRTIVCLMFCPNVVHFRCLSDVLISNLILIFIIMSATSSFLSCLFVLTAVSTPYIIAGLATVLNILHLICTGANSNLYVLFQLRRWS